MSAHNSHTSVNVCMHEILIQICIGAEMAPCMNACVHCIQSICVSHCAAPRALMV